jgi:hypothetical protein
MNRAAAGKSLEAVGKTSRRRLNRKLIVQAAARNQDESRRAES